MSHRETDYFITNGAVLDQLLNGTQGTLSN
jgi:hypothetical protein